MTYERLIIAVDEVAPELEGVAYKLLWRLIALAIHRGTPGVDTSVRELARGLNTSKEGTARAIRELAQYIQVTARDGGGTMFSLPPDWFPPQRTLFTDDSLGGNFHNRPTDQDGTVLFTRTPASYSPGHQRPGHQDTRPTDQDTSVPLTRTPVLLTRTQRPTDQDASHDGTGEDPCARVDRSIDSDCAQQDLIVRVDRAVHSEEIPPTQQQDAEILRDTLVAYRNQFPDRPRLSDAPDDTVIAHCLALADLEELHRVLRTLAEHRVKPQPSDMWFFFTLANKILGVPSTLIHERMKKAKGKNRPKNQTPYLFAPELVKATATAMRRLG